MSEEDSWEALLLKIKKHDEWNDPLALEHLKWLLSMRITQLLSGDK